MTPRGTGRAPPWVTTRGDGTIVVRTGIAPSGRFVSQIMSQAGFEYVSSSTEAEARLAHDEMVDRLDAALLGRLETGREGSEG